MSNELRSLGAAVGSVFAMGGGVYAMGLSTIYAARSAELAEYKSGSADTLTSMMSVFTPAPEYSGATESPYLVRAEGAEDWAYVLIVTAVGLAALAMTSRRQKS